MKHSFVDSDFCQEDQAFDPPLRPKYLDHFVGQEALKERLHVLLSAAKQRKEPLPHCLFAGPPGLGKTTLSHILAEEMGTRLVISSGPALDKAKDLAGILTNLEEGDIFFIDEIHRLGKQVEEYLYPAIESFSLDILLDSGPSARTVRLDLKPFTLVGATTKTGLLSSPLRSRFGFTGRLEFYQEEQLAQVILRTASLLDFAIKKEHAHAIAKRARGTPRIANHLLRWVRDYCQVRADHLVNDTTVYQALEMLQIDALGLDEMDKRFLRLIIENYQGGPVGLTTLAAACGEEPQTLEEVTEPFLLLHGLLKKTARGRVVTQKAIDHLGLALEQKK